MSYQKLIDKVYENIKGVISEMADDVEFTVSIARPGFGDLSCNAAFLLAKKLKMNPFEISKMLSKRYETHLDDFISRTEAHPSGYLNFFVDQPTVNKAVILESISDNYGCITSKSKTITIEHTSVNPNKALHIGHVRNIVIGDVLARIMRKAGYRVNVLNYVDDSGLQVADIILGFKEIGFSQEPPNGQKFDRYCGDTVYVGTTEMYESDSELEKKRGQVLRDLEDGNSETAKFADIITKRVLKCQLETCWSLSVTYDCLNFESHIVRSGLWKSVFEKLKNMGLVEYESEGKNSRCWVIRGLDGQDDKVLVRSNGTATYMAKDIPYAAWKLGLVDDPFSYERYAEMQPGRILWQTSLLKSDESGRNYSGDMVVTVIDSRQARLQQIITSLMVGLESKVSYIHLGYESVTLSSETAKTLGIDTGGRSAQMSGRRGTYVSADHVLEMLRDKAGRETERRNPKMDKDEIKEVANNVSVATIRYEMIKQDLDKSISFDMARSLSMEGNTASYIQYGLVRAARVLEKSGINPDFDAKYDLLSGEFEKTLVRLIGLFEMQVRDASSNYSPKVIARYCYDLASAFNGFYEHVRILDSTKDSELVNARLCLVRSFISTLEKALELVGIPVPSRM